MSFVHTITAGGQTWTHRIRMLRQVIRVSTGLSMVFSGIYWIGLMIQLPMVYYTALFYYLKAVLNGFSSTSIYVDRTFWADAAHVYLSSDSSFVSVERVSAVTKPYVNTLIKHAEVNFNSASTVFLISTVCVLLFFLYRGMSTTRKNHLSGQKISRPFVTKLKLFLHRKASDIHVGKVPLVKESETQHFLITGGTGSGKTNCLHHLLKQIRERGDRAIIVDTSNIFTNRYFKGSSDKLLNPFEENTELWSPWAECQNSFDYDALAESLIPHSFSENENYWRTSARTVLSALFSRLNDTKRTSELTDWLLYRPLAELCQLVEGTKAAAHMDIHAEKTAASIRSVASSFISSFEYIKDSKEPFSIKRWVENEESNQGWLFLHAHPAQRSSLTPLLSAWLSIAIRSLLNQPTSRTRRLWLILDELPSLNKVKDIELLLAEGRKYGGCAVLALQSPSQLEAIYGHNTTSTIIGNCSTKIIFSEQDPQIAFQISKAFGEREVLEYNEGLSYGAHEVRDGVSLSSQKKMVPVVTATQIQSLSPNTAFLRLPGNWPVSLIKLEIAK